MWGVCRLLELEVSIPQGCGALFAALVWSPAWLWTLHNVLAAYSHVNLD